jgi:hypothetical protein
MNCPNCTQPLLNEGEWPYSHQQDRKPTMTFQCIRWSCIPCSIYIYRNLDLMEPSDVVA